MTVMSDGSSESSSALPALRGAPLEIEHVGPSGSWEVTSQVWTPLVGERTTSKASASKILQSEVTMGLMVEHSSSFHAVIAPCPSRLQLLERCTARTLQQAMLNQSLVSPISQLFQHRVRDVTTDEASTNKLCEKSMACFDKFGSWVSRHGNCEVHVAARVFGASLSLLDKDVSGMVRHALSLNVGANLAMFRKALRAEIMSRGIRILQGPPPLSTRQHRWFMLRLFCARGANSIERRLLLVLLPNGDWTKDQPGIYVPNPRAISPQLALDVLCNGLVTALAGSAFHVYPRHRWTGADLSLDRCGILEAVHRLGSGAYARFMQMWGREEEVPNESATIGASGALALENSADPHSPAGEAGDGDQPENQGDEGRQDKSAAFNAKSRRMASEWWSSEPFDRLLLMRVVMEPLRVLLTAKLDISGEAWETRQVSKLAEASLEGAPLRRDYVVQVAADNVVESECIGKAKALMRHPEFWSGFPGGSRTVKNRALAFRMLSKVRCQIHDLLVAPHRKFPILLFTLMSHPERFEELKAVPPCMRDAVSHEFFTKFPQGPASPRAMAFLEFLARTMSLDIAQIEARHAAVRRLLSCPGRRRPTPWGSCDCPPSGYCSRQGDGTCSSAKVSELVAMKLHPSKPPLPNQPLLLA